MSYEFGSCRADELTDLVDLANRVFRVRRPGDMGDEYPLVFEAQNLQNLMVARSHGRIVAHVGICLRDASILGARLRVASIGAVATDPDHRGQGIASRLMENARRRAIECGASLMLISGTRGLYRRLGYVQVGDFRSYTVPAGELTVSVGVEPVTDADLPDVVRLYQREPVRFFRPREDWHKLLAAGMLMNQPSELLLVRQDGTPAAYAGVQQPAPGAGAATPVQIREFAGSRSALAEALPGLARRCGAPACELVTWPSDTGWRAQADRRGWRAEATTFPGTLGIIDPERFLAAVRPLLAERAGEDLELAADGEGARLVVPGETVRLENHAQLTALVFRGRTEDARIPDLPAAAREAVDAALPLPLLWHGYNYV